MLDDAHPVFLLASNSAGPLAALASSQADSGALVRAVSSADEAIEAVRGPQVPSLVLLDDELPGMAVEQLLAAMHAGTEDHRFPIVVISDDGLPQWRDRLAEGVIDDLFPRDMRPFHWRLRVEHVLRTFRHMRELEHLRETTGRDTDVLTGLWNRAALLSMLFRETDRVQRMSTSLSLMLFEIDDVAHWNARLGAAGCEDLVRQAVGRVQRLLRSYDLFGRVGAAGFALGLPGCTAVNAVALAERIRAEVFGVPFCAGGVSVRLTGNFGIATSHGRSPLVVLREAEQALEAAKSAGPEVIRTSRDGPQPPPPVEFLSATVAKDRVTR
jgi:two-component system, cell cycle response regulator